MKEEDGNVTVFSVFMLVLIIMITGAAVDIMRFEAVRTSMQNTMDRAVLAAADLDQKQDPTEVVRDYLLKSGITKVKPGVTVNEGFNYRTVKASGVSDIDTIFLKMSGFDTLYAPALSAADEKIANVEISLVLDISGSMRWNSRMDRLRPAAKHFVDKVMNEESVGVTTLNLIPFAGHVNPGDIMFDYFRGERPNVPVIEPEEPGDFFAPWEQAISNIVMYFDLDGDEIFDRAHKIEGFPENAPRDADEFIAGAVGYVSQHDSRIDANATFLGASIKGGRQSTRYFTVYGDSNGPESDLGPTKNRGKIPGSTYQYGSIDFEYYAQYYTGGGDTVTDRNVNMPSSCIEIYDAEFSTTALPSSDDYVPHFHHWEIDDAVMDWGWCPEDDTAIQYYSSNATQLKAFIDDIRLHDGTGAQYGMKYALALLDPATRAAVSHLIAENVIDASFEGRPIDWDDYETEKYIVIMTDGIVTEQVRPTDPYAAINGEVVLTEQDGSARYEFSARNKNVTNLYSQCDLAKEKGVTVFSIAFETDTASAQEMKNCASSESHFFHVQGQEIYEAFDTIARQINNLRLVQ
ncbi:hypothetical protein Salmuc_04843 [Salipiger mucosus DSM 16094]|uniref:Putative Flp pilus-assembly TadG-like N-terminal domain-containing protein n=1 Tax=Salipiger mucosus DSM 16094 TaxID=1123237 RepID=S9R109_9RHOB|nr:hypothetical protein Salmuc_04843 [Salipiger mucosus DSM 16094]